MSARFQAIHDLATAQVDAVRRELGKQESQRAQLSVGIVDTEAGMIAAGDAAGPALREQFSLFWQARQSLLTKLRHDLNTVEVGIIKTREALREAHRRLAALDVLRERDRIEANRQEQRAEQRRNDEFAAIRRQMAVEGSAA